MPSTEEIFYCKDTDISCNSKEAEVAILISDKADFKDNKHNQR